MKYMHQIIAEQDSEQQRRYLESIGPLGRIIDGHLTFMLFLAFVCSAGFFIGFLIGSFL
jgi:hypothetical protein